jgi:hypothetical protein
MRTKNATIAPPPPHPHVETRTKTPKTPNFNSSKNILFAIQRKIPKFPQKKKPQLVTLFPVYSRLLPFSELGPQKSPAQNLSNSYSTDPIISHFSQSYY